MYSNWLATPYGCEYNFRMGLVNQVSSPTDCAVELCSTLLSLKLQLHAILLDTTFPPPTYTFNSETGPTFIRPGKCMFPTPIALRWRASPVMQPCNNWRHGFRFTTLERPSRSCRGHPWCHAICLVPRLFLGLYWPRSEFSATLYVLRTMMMPMANLGEIPCYFFLYASKIS